MPVILTSHTSKNGLATGEPKRSTESVWPSNTEERFISCEPGLGIPQRKWEEAGGKGRKACQAFSSAAGKENALQEGGAGHREALSLWDEKAGQGRRKADFFFLLQSKDSSYRPPFRDGSLLDSSTFHPSITSRPLRNFQRVPVLESAPRLQALL
ncbi:hypothetical protein Q8A67_005067 [Cirrhinus molitorella]|uniref:Uncharacterized protein n=1 Tax=Cirrhinus molitorella TaxID=172907 RepID=A0AA88Q1L1_9TELE|nr:hypothetical protein Q8A67_005067 [Cirrhinus molitorella]